MFVLPKEVAEIAEGLLVGAYQEDAEIIGLALDERVYRERPPQAARLDEAVDLAVGVAGDVGEDRAARRLLGMPVHRDDREHLLDRPDVGQRLEYREVAVVDVGQRLLEVVEAGRHALRLLQHGEDVPDDVQKMFSASDSERSRIWPRRKRSRISSR